MMQLPRYESYKDSGVEWLGEIPEHWGCDSLRSATILKSDKNRPDLQVLSVYREYGVIIKDSRDDNHNATSLDTSTYKVVRPGDLVVNKMKAWQGSMGVSEYEGVVSPAYITCKTNQDDFHPKYLHYLLRSKGYVGVYNSISYGVRIGQWDLRYEDFKKVVIPIPLIREQKRIAAFLDQKTAEIDEAIGKKKKLVELLQEQKSILINQAVTKGLNPDAPMKDSGVEWIGEIPEHWEVRPLKMCSFLIKDGLHNTPEKYESGINFISTQHVRNNRISISNASKISPKDFKIGHPKYAPDVGDVLITLVGSIGFSAIITKEHTPLSFTRHVGYVRCNQNLLNKFLCFYFESNLFLNFINRNVSKTAQPSIYLSSLANHKIPVPPIDEQQEISEYIAKLSEFYEKSFETISYELEKLYEFKRSLISSAVTGKIKV